MSILDVAPDPVNVGVVVAVVMFISVAVIELAGALVFFLWYRKRSMRAREMIRPEANSPVGSPRVSKG